MSEKRFQVYKSSAGSGKTFTLVRAYLGLVLKNPEKYRNILAITFTNKAANEMKNRIVSSLTGLSRPVETWPQGLKMMVEPIKNESGFSDEQIRQRAVKVITGILHNYSDLSATTIDSFMQRVIRTFALDLELPQNYEVELDVGMLRQRAVDRLIDQAGSHKTLTNLLVHYIETKTEDDKSWRIENNLNDIAKALFREDGMQQREALQSMDYPDYQEYYGRIKSLINDFDNKLIGIGERALKLVNEARLEFDDFYYGKTGALGYFIKLSTGSFKDLINPGKRILTAVNDGSWSKSNQKKDIITRIESITPQLIDYFNQSQQLAHASFAQYKTMKLLLNHLYPLAVLGSIGLIIEDIRDEERILPISEFNSIIAGITQTESIPYIYERLGEKFHHLMIDEFQDTSLLQWRNLLPLVENALSENHLNLVVGDAKQAIYRWRNGDVDQFIALPGLSGEKTPINLLREQVLISQFEGLELPVNWRSHKAIVEFNNQFFRHLSKRLPEAYKPVYENLDQQYNTEKSQGFVQIEFSDPADDDETLMLERLPALVEELTSLNYQLQDIAVLCRTNDQGSLVARHLLQHGIQVISSESMRLEFSENVRLLVSMLRIVVDPKDQLACAEALVILSRQGKFDPMTIHEVFSEVLDPGHKNRGNNQFHANTFENFLNKQDIQFARNQLQSLPLYDLAEALINLLRLNASQDIYLQFFLNELHTAVVKKFMTKPELPAWWQEKARLVSVLFPEGLNAVKVMTVHKAKGLEFPVVILPFATFKQKFSIDNVWVQINEPDLKNLKTAYLPVKSLQGTIYENVWKSESDKSLLDLVNLLYVAFTRAEERMYILTTLPAKKSEEKNSVPDFLNDFISQTDPGYSCSTDQPWIFPESDQKTQRKAVSGASEPELKLVEDIRSDQWRHKALISNRSRGRWFGEEPETAIDFGNIVHDLLAKIRTDSDLNIALERFLLSGELKKNTVERLFSILKNIISHPALRIFFDGNKNILPEAEILLPDGQIFRPDRLLIDSEIILVAEFKTGKPHNAHRNQLMTYLEIISQIYKQKVKGLLVYANQVECTVEEVIPNQ